jgi:predicted enzyme related to lactoylglutathione lyase
MYPVSDLAGAASFYREVLGLPQEMYSDEWQWAEFNCGNVTLALKGGSKPSGDSAGARVALGVEDVQTAHEELKQKGVRVVAGPTDYSVCWALEILDPDGNTVIIHKRADGTFGQGAPSA